jgi:(4S)-4-hydroxy-5-phosphonooxypentane-2,3-dione isomerase
MIVYCVEVSVLHGKETDFLKATEENHIQTRQEPGNKRFDVLQQQEDPSRFFLYEVYESQEAVNAHKETAHYLKWRETVAPWMASPRKGISHIPHFPKEIASW